MNTAFHNLPPVSVILPVHNAEKSLSRAVESVINQTYPNWELILSENGSTDGTPDLCRHWENKDSRIRTIFLSEKGISAALNAGIEKSRFPLIARMDADDISYPARLEMQVHYLVQNPQIGLVSGLVDFFTDSDKAFGYREYVNQINSLVSCRDIYNYRFVESPLAHPSVMFRKNLIDAFGPYSTENIPEDYELWLRWMDKGVQMAKIPEPVIQWNDSAVRLSRNHPNYSAESFDLVRYSYLARHLIKSGIGDKQLFVWGGGKLANRKLRLLQTFYPFQPASIIDVKPKEKLPQGHIHYSEVPSPKNAFIISMVSNRGRFREIELFLRERGYGINRDFIPAG